MIMALITGAFVGSFLNVVIHRGPALWRLVDTPDGDRGSLLGPRSYCPACRSPIRYRDLIPIFSYAALKGRCANCQGAISPRYPLVEALAAMHAGAALLLFGPTITALFAALFGWLLIVLAAIDGETGYLPDWLTGLLALTGLTANAVSLFVAPLDAAIGAAAGVIAFWAIGAFWQKFRGIEALGLGDAKLLGALGAWMGWEALPLIVLAGSLASLAGVAISNLRGSAVGVRDAVPFGPGLAFGGYLVFAATAFAP